MAFRRFCENIFAYFSPLALDFWPIAFLSAGRVFFYWLVLSKISSGGSPADKTPGVYTIYYIYTPPLHSLFFPSPARRRTGNRERKTHRKNPVRRIGCYSPLPGKTGDKVSTSSGQLGTLE